MVVGQDYRAISKIIRGERVTDGGGVKLLRSLGTRDLDHFDPFLLLDEFRSNESGDYMAGFPDHPHRGFETVTYMLAGLMEHRDSRGNSGVLKGGGVQWMTAGRGIVHSEMPKQKEGLIWGFQLWVNLPASQKMCAPRYQNIEPEMVPEVKRTDGTVIRVIAGESDGVAGAVNGIATDPLYLDVNLPPDGVYEHTIPAEHSTLAYIFEGASIIGGEKIGHPSLAAFDEQGGAVRFKACAQGARFLLLAARKLEEPISRYGPFVMNSREELTQAFEDYREGRFYIPLSRWEAKESPQRFPSPLEFLHTVTGWFWGDPRWPVFR